MILSEPDALYAADKFIDYYTQFNRIDDYLRYVKKDRISQSAGSIFGADDEMFNNFNIHPNDMDIKVHIVDTNPKTTSKYNQWLYSETLNLTASNPIEEAIPGRTHKWIVTETNTDKVIGVVRFGSPTINSKPGVMTTLVKSSLCLISMLILLWVLILYRLNLLDTITSAENFWHY